MKHFLSSLLLLLTIAPLSAQKRTPEAGQLFFASYEDRENDLVKSNPYIIGALRTIKWANIETRDGIYDWTEIDRFIEEWSAAGKKVALRLQWSTSGYWKDPMAKTPTPKWVWEKGAKYVYHAPSGTEIPLFWDPIYQHYALRFLGKVAERYDNNPNILFIDITPGAETNPYRFRTIDRKDPEFKKTFAATPASDGRSYTEMLWQQTILDWIPKATALFHNLPTEIALNKGSLYDGNNFELFGNKAVECGMYIGQNGLSAGRYTESESAKVQILQRWAKKTKIFFEMVGSTSLDEVGSLRGVIDAAIRGGCSYLNVYAKDVLRGTKGWDDYDKSYEEALAYGAQMLSSTSTDSK